MSSPIPLFVRKLYPFTDQQNNNHIIIIFSEISQLNPKKYVKLEFLKICYISAISTFTLHPLLTLMTPLCKDASLFSWLPCMVWLSVPLIFDFVAPSPHPSQYHYTPSSLPASLLESVWCWSSLRSHSASNSHLSLLILPFIPSLSPQSKPQIIHHSAFVFVLFQSCKLRDFLIK